MGAGAAARLDLDGESLPVVWDIDFLYGPKTDGDAESYVLCEINASSTFAFPEHAMPGVAAAALNGSERRPISAMLDAGAEPGT